MKSRNSRLARSGSCTPLTCGMSIYPELPDNFAELVIAQEMKLDSSCWIQNIQELVALYGQAVEHYNNIGNSIYIDYQERMQKMLMREDVMEAMHASSTKAQANREFSMSKESRFERNKVMRSTALQHKKIAQNEVQSPQCDRMFNMQKQNTESTAKKLIDDFEKQNNTFQKRIKMRKDRRARNLSLPDLHIHSAEMSAGGPAEISAGGPSLEKHLNSSDSKIEAIMERWYQLKTLLITEVRCNYETQIRENQAKSKSPGDVMSLVADQLRQQMEQEIQVLGKKLDETRKEEIRAMREMEKENRSNF